MRHVPKPITTRVLLIISIFLQLIFLGSVTQWSKIKYGEYVYPDWAQAVAWLLPLLSFLAMPIRAIYEIFHPKGSFRQVQQAIEILKYGSLRWFYNFFCTTDTVKKKSTIYLQKRQNSHLGTRESIEKNLWRWIWSKRTVGFRAGLFKARLS